MVLFLGNICFQTKYPKRFRLYKYMYTKFLITSSKDHQLGCMLIYCWTLEIHNSRDSSLKMHRNSSWSWLFICGHIYRVYIYSSCFVKTELFTLKIIKSTF